MCCAGRTDDLRAPSQVGRAPLAGPRNAYRVGAKALRRNLASLQSLMASSRARVRSRSLHLRPGAMATAVRSPSALAGQLHRVPAVGCDPIPRFWESVRGPPPSSRTLFHQRAIEPGAAGAGLIDKDQMFGLRLHLSDELINVTLTGANASEVGDQQCDLEPHRQPQSSLCGPSPCR